MVKNSLTISRLGQALVATAHKIAQRTRASAPLEPEPGPPGGAVA